jgi:hypothetical protein
MAWWQDGTRAVDINPKTEGYYNRQTVEAAVSDAWTQIEEWDYDKDAHGYCHFRPILLRLLTEIERLEAENRQHREDARDMEITIRDRDTEIARLRDILDPAAEDGV